ncbi:glycoside hydrolase family 13 protein [Thelephora ganbajun]|uniref:Glycoside hydrolase family 13 protein n=1 Tax=Thelephora ganbajun TaxID=370292 RepID=A0ACB6ZKW7_THEGA|nr:glycoside hydrolase family 13 protein [Thelephora ganbajun]
MGLLKALAVSSFLFVSSLAASASDWHSRSIYQLVTDRFALTDGSGPACNTEDRKYCGGTYRGIMNHLDYIQNMGFDAIWVSPVVSTFEGSSAYGEGYHGYWPQDLYSLNSHFGTGEDLKALAGALHKRNMYLMVDVVVNHLASKDFPPPFSSFNPFNRESDFHPRCLITDYNNQTQVEQCWLGDDKVALIDVNTEKDEIINTYNNWIKTLVGNYSVDGIRIDTVKHIRKDFWPNFASSSGVYTIGEVLHNETDYVAGYTHVLDAVLDYPTWFPLVAGFQTQFGNLSSLARVITTSQSAYKNGLFGTASFLENHDQPRFPSLTNDTARLRNAITFPFVHDGIPIVYYGQEQGYAGGPDPANREALWFSGYVQDKDLVKHIKTLNGARKAAITANSQFLSTAVRPATGHFPDLLETTLAVSKPPMLALFTNVGSSGTASWKVPKSGHSGNTQLIDVLSCTILTTNSDGGLTTNTTNGLPRVYLPVSALSASNKICINNLSTGNSAPGGAMPSLMLVGLASFVSLLM